MSSTSTTDPFKIENLFDVKGLVVLITGGGTGIGLMMTLALASNGARVYILGRRFDVLEKTAKSHSVGLPEGAAIIPIQGDVTSKDSIKATLEQIQKMEKYIDILINNSGVHGPFWMGKPRGTAEALAASMFEDDYEEALSVLQTNVLGLYYMSAAFIPLLAKSPNHPQIINVTSMASFGRQIMPGFVYAGSKAAATHMTKILSTELRNTNIRVNGIAPGLFPSGLTTENTGEDNHSVWDDADGTYGIPVSKSAGGKVGQKSDIASTVLYLANKNQQYASGAILLVDGGVMNEMPSTY